MWISLHASENSEQLDNIQNNSNANLVKGKETEN